MDEYGKHYSDDSFWTKAKTFARKAGREVIEKALTLYHAAQDAETPHWARAVIIGVLGYFILPADAIPDPTPVVGFADDLGAIAAAFGLLAVHIKAEHRERARRTTDEWFGPRADDPEPEGDAT